MTKKGFIKFTRVVHQLTKDIQQYTQKVFEYRNISPVPIKEAFLNSNVLNFVPAHKEVIEQTVQHEKDNKRKYDLQ